MSASSGASPAATRSRRTRSTPATRTTKPRPPRWVRKASRRAAPTTNDAALPQNPHLTLTKMGAFVDGGSEPNGYADPGETVHYTFSIENDGNVTLSSLLLSDSLGLELIGPTGGGDSDFDGLLDVGETWTFEGDYGLTAADIAAGTVHNEATASAQGPHGQAVSDDASADTPLPPPPPAALMTLDKSDLQGTIFVDSNENGSADTGTGTSGD